MLGAREDRDEILLGARRRQAALPRPPPRELRLNVFLGERPAEQRSTPRCLSAAANRRVRTPEPVVVRGMWGLANGAQGVRCAWVRAHTATITAGGWSVWRTCEAGRHR